MRDINSSCAARRRRLVFTAIAVNTKSVGFLMDEKVLRFPISFLYNIIYVRVHTLCSLCHANTTQSHQSIAAQHSRNRL